MSSPASGDTEEVDVLIVGAGPAGLSTALSLYHYTHLRSDASTTSEGTNVKRESSPKPKILLVDALPQGQNESRALAVHARTLEVHIVTSVTRSARLIFSI
jgi:thioredoxin reductase